MLGSLESQKGLVCSSNKFVFVGAGELVSVDGDLAVDDDEITRLSIVDHGFVNGFMKDHSPPSLSRALYSR